MRALIVLAMGIVLGFWLGLIFIKETPVFIYIEKGDADGEYYNK